MSVSTVRPFFLGGKQKIKRLSSERALAHQDNNQIIKISVNQCMAQEPSNWLSIDALLYSRIFFMKHFALDELSHRHQLRLASDTNCNCFHSTHWYLLSFFFSSLARSFFLCHTHFVCVCALKWKISRLCAHFLVIWSNGFERARDDDENHFNL